MQQFRHLLIGSILAGGAAFGAATAAAETVTFMNWTYAEEAGKPIMQTMMDGFAATTGNQIEPFAYAWGEMQRNLVLRSRSNTLPNITQLTERWLPTAAALPGVVDFNEVYGPERLAELFDPALLTMGQIDGKQLGLPWIGGSVGMVANTAVLEQAGVAEIPTTVDAFRQALVAVRDAVPNSVPYALATKNNNSMILDFQIWVWTFGGHIITPEGDVVIDSDEGRAALGFLVDLMEEGLAAPEIDRPDARRLAAQNASAFYIDAPVARTMLRQFSGQGEAFDVNVKPMATPVLAAGNTPASVEWGHLLMMFDNGDTSLEGAPAAWLDYLLSDEVLIAYATNQSVLPTTKTGLAAPAVTSDPYLIAWAEAAVDPARLETAYFDNAADLTNIIGEEVQAALLGQKTADEAVATMAERLDQALASVR